MKPVDTDDGSHGGGGDDDKCVERGGGGVHPTASQNLVSTFKIKKLHMKFHRLLPLGIIS